MNKNPQEKKDENYKFIDLFAGDVVTAKTIEIIAERL